MKKLLLFSAFMVLFTNHVQSQSFYYFEPRITASASVAWYRISLDDFDSVYKGRSGFSPGGSIGVRVWGSHYAMVKMRQFNKSGKSGIHPTSGLNLENARWRETWYTVGVRVQPSLSGKGGSYYGFGVAFYQVDEEPGLSVFEANNANDQGDTGNGFYLELGIQYYLWKRAAAFFEIEVASGGMRGRSGFEAFSVGGWRFALGLNIFAF
jgi:hypothetical protein